jgi:uncharacterized protein YndB with AHSA1/START domain
MAAIRESVEIARRPEDVFAYVDDLARHSEWQAGLVSAHVETEGPTRVGTRVSEVRRMGKREQTIAYEITVHEPPRRAEFRGTNGPIRPIGKITVDSVDDGARSRVTVELDFEGHGFGKLLLPMARSQARKQVPLDQKALKAELERAPV